jgi:hypothetical protein
VGAHHLAIVGDPGENHTAIAVNGNCSFTSGVSNITISNVGIGIEVDRTVTTGTAVFTGSAVVITARSGGMVILDEFSSGNLTGSSITLAGVAGAIGVGISSGDANLNGTNINLMSNVSAASRGVVMLGMQAMATVGITGGTITLADSGMAGAVAVDIQNGIATLSGAAVRVGGNAHGVVAQNASRVDLSGASSLASTCATTGDTNGCTTAGSVSGHGIFVPSSPANVPATINLGGTTTVSRFQAGVYMGDGTLNTSGTPTINGNTADGIRVWNYNTATGVIARTTIGGTTTVTGNAAVGISIDTPVAPASITGAVIRMNGSDGVNISTGVETSVLTSTINMNTGDGIEVASGQPTTTSGFQTVAVSNMITQNAGRGVYLSGLGPRTEMSLQGNTISGNGLEGVRITELGAAQPTVVALLNNTITGNLTTAAAAPAHILAGGLYITDNDLAGSEQEGGVQVILGEALGNRIFDNGRHEIGFDVAQNDGAGGPWDLSSNAGGVDATTLCQAAANPNYAYCYGPTGTNMAIAIPAGSNIEVKAKGMHFQQTNPVAGLDFSSEIPGPPPGCVSGMCTPEPPEGVFLSCPTDSTVPDPMTGCGAAGP